MKLFVSCRRVYGLGLLLALALSEPGGALAQTLEQQLVLRPGWNSIFLEVQPSNTAPDVVFSHPAIQSVWTWSARLAATTFIEDPAEPSWNTSEWLVYFPRNSTNAFLSTLFGVYAQRAYLIKVTASSDVEMVIAGVPSLRIPEWAPDAYNLRGFPVDTTRDHVSFLDFFRPSAAHYRSATRTLETIFTLNAAGQWIAVSPTNAMERGRAYWVYTRGSSDYKAPLYVETVSPAGIDFTDASQYKEITFGNATTNTMTCFIGNAGVIPMVYQSLSSIVTEAGWNDLGTMYSKSLEPRQSLALRLALKPAAMTSGAYAGDLFVVSDGATTRWYVPVTAQRVAE